MQAGENNIAFKYYKKSLESDPGNDNAKKMLKQISNNK